MPIQHIPGQTHNPTEEETMSAIRSILIDVESPKPSRSAARRAPVRAHAENICEPRAFVEQTHVPNPQRRALDLPELNSAEAPTDRRAFTMPKWSMPLGRPLARVFVKVRSFRPSLRLVALLCMALLIVSRPHWFVISGVLIVTVLVGTFLFLGSDRIWRMIMAGLNTMEVRNPERAARIRTRLDRLAFGWDQILDFFPERLVEGLYMPDLQAMQDAEAAHAAVLEARLDRMAHDG